MSLVCACQVLADIEVAQSLQAQKVKEEEEEEVVHPLDQDYALLCCQLSLLDPASREYQVPLVPRCPVTGSTPKVPTAPQGLWALLGWLPVVTPLSCFPPWQLIQNYVSQTGHKLRILNIWQVARDGEVRRRSCLPPSHSGETLVAPQDGALSASGLRAFPPRGA